MRAAFVTREKCETCGANLVASYLWIRAWALECPNQLDRTHSDYINYVTKRPREYKVGRGVTPIRKVAT